MLNRIAKALPSVVAVVAFCGLLAGAVAPAAAQATAEHREMAGKLVKIIRADAGFGQIIPAIIDDAKTLFIRTNPDLSKDITEVADQIGEELQKKRTDLTEKVIDAYAETFTAEELTQIITFYETPAGKKLAESADALTLKTLDAARDWGDKMSEDIVGMIRAEMLKRGHNL
ncbi:MAG: DUF2059 domain-containing protein [Hyphomicrobiales bacterium]|nr:DUF2059 domain-containing protein [Hyphomicrobiales bacterium]